MPKITTFISYDTQAEEAVDYYLSVFETGKIVSTMRRGDGGPVLSLTFELLGQTFIALNGGPSFTFSQGVSLFVGCESQAEIDRYWAKLSDGGQEIQCGWVTDKFGLTWQIVPNALGEMLGGKDPARAGRAMQAMLQMKKLDIAALKRAYDAA